MPCFNICHKGEYKSTRGDQPTKSAQENDGSHLKRVKSSSPKKLKASGPPNPSSSRPCAKHWALILQIPWGFRCRSQIPPCTLQPPCKLTCNPRRGRKLTSEGARSMGASSDTQYSAHVYSMVNIEQWIFNHLSIIF